MGRDHERGDQAETAPARVIVSVGLGLSGLGPELRICGRRFDSSRGHSRKPCKQVVAGEASDAEIAVGQRVGQHERRVECLAHAVRDQLVDLAGGVEPRCFQDLCVLRIRNVAVYGPTKTRGPTIAIHPWIRGSRLDEAASGASRSLDTGRRPFAGTRPTAPGSSPSPASPAPPGGSRTGPCDPRRSTARPLPRRLAGR